VIGNGKFLQRAFLTLLKKRSAKTMKKICLVRYLMIFILGVSLCLPNFADAFSKQRSMSPLKKKMLARIFDLSSEQIAALEELKATTQSEVEPLAEDMKELALLVPEILLAEEIDVEDAESKLGEIVDLQCEISSIEAYAGLEGFQILTSEKRLLTSEQRQGIVVFAENALDLFQYISDYPGWDKIKDDFEQYLEPIIDDCHPDNIPRSPGLDLTDEQIEAFAQLGDDTKAVIEPLEDEIMVVGVELLGILMADEPEIDDAQGVLATILGLDCQISDIAANAVLAGVQILTSEQRQTILEKIESRQSRRGRWGHWGPSGE
jgi:Spy/CpxP family protein refolding chaperone